MKRRPNPTVVCFRLAGADARSFDAWLLQTGQTRQGILEGLFYDWMRSVGLSPAVPGPGPVALGEEDGSAAEDMFGRESR